MDNTKKTPQTKSDKLRFTFLIQPNLLSQIKLISYISNQKLYEIINLSIQSYIDIYNKTHNTNIESLINLNNTQNSPLNPKSK